MTGGVPEHFDTSRRTPPALASVGFRGRLALAREYFRLSRDMSRLTHHRRRIVSQSQRNLSENQIAYLVQQTI